MLFLHLHKMQAISVAYFLLLWKINLSKRINSWSKEFAPKGANSFLKELTIPKKGVKNEYGRVAFPE